MKPIPPLKVYNIALVCGTLIGWEPFMSTVKPIRFTAYELRSPPSCSNLIFDVRLRQFLVVNCRWVAVQEKRR